MIRILHLADLHLGYLPPWEDMSEARRQERDARLSAAVDWALAHGVHLVLIAGDLFETHRPPAPLVDSVIRDLGRLVRSGVHVVTLPGNHDEISYHDSVYRKEEARWPGTLITNPNMARSVTLTCRGHDVHIYSLAYTSGLTRAEKPLAEFPQPEGEGFHIAMLHGSLDWDRGERSLPIDGQALEAAGYHYVALGHIHRYAVRGRERPIVYAGMIEGKDFDDPGTGEYVVVTLEEGGASIAREAAGARRLVTVELDAGAYDGWDELVEAARASIPDGAAARVVLKGAPVFAVRAERLKAALAGGAYYVDVVDETDGIADELIRSLAAEPTVRGAFVQRMLRRLEAAEPGQEKLIRKSLMRGLEALGWEGLS